MLKKIIILLVVLVVVAFAWWTISPLFITKEVDDKLDPELEALLEQIDKETETEVATSEAPIVAPDTNYQTDAETETFKPNNKVPEATDITQTENNQAGPNQVNVPPQILPEVPESGTISEHQNPPRPGGEPPPTQNIVTKPVVPPRAEDVSLPPPPTPSGPIPSVQPTPSVSAKLPISHTPGHTASGNVRVIRMPKETIVRYENYQGTNGPDLRIYLSTDLEATDFVELGKAKGTKGNINYSVPSGVNIDDYNYVLTWCKPFRTLFDYAELDI